MQEKKNSCSLAGLLANFPNEPDSFRQQLAEAITAYLRVESSDEKKKKQKKQRKKLLKVQKLPLQKVPLLKHRQPTIRQPKPLKETDKELLLLEI